MTEKRYSYDNKTISLLKNGEFWLDGQVDTACNHSEICNELNRLLDENEQLKQYKQSVTDVLFNWSKKNLTMEQMKVVIAIIIELNIEK